MPTCEAVANALYALPPLQDASSAYGLGFALVFTPGLLAWAGSRVVAAIRSISNG